MAETNATILIPDISGFTEFVTTTELTHSTVAINMLIDSIVNTVGDRYEVSEIEGDAVLLIRKGQAPSQKEITELCIEIFNAFHFQRKWMQEYTVCPCGACRSLVNLTLKFVVHHGPLAEIKVGHFIKQSGTEMIVAHRLLKNSIDNHEYLLMTEKLVGECAGPSCADDFEWASSSEEYSSIGKVPYRFTLLTEARKKVPEPPTPKRDYRVDTTAYLEVNITAAFMDTYMQLMNIPGRAAWMPGLKKVEQEVAHVFIGSVHRCSFENYDVVVSPLRMDLEDDRIIYAESWQVSEPDLSLVYEYIFRKVSDNETNLSMRFMTTRDIPESPETSALLSQRMQAMGEQFKLHCEQRR